MSKNKTQEPTPAHVAEKATRTAKLPALALIGIFGSESALNALVRERDGDIRRVGVGDRVDGRTIAAIDKDRLILGSGGDTRTLSLPDA